MLGEAGGPESAVSCSVRVLRPGASVVPSVAFDEMNWPFCVLTVASTVPDQSDVAVHVR